MKTVNSKKIRNLRRDRNASILKRMENGDTLTAFDSYSSWFPPRPVIEKNIDDIQKLYGVSTDHRLVKALDDVMETGEVPKREVDKDNPMRIA